MHSKSFTAVMVPEPIPGQILYFLGAGASMAAYSRMPAMDGFLELGFEYANAEKDHPEGAWPYWEMITRQEQIFSEHGVWWKPYKPSPSSTDFMDEMSPTPERGYERLALDILNAGNEDDKIRDTQEYLSRLKQRKSAKAQSRRRANIEWLLTRAEEFALATDDDKPFQVTQNFIVWVLAKLEQEIMSSPAKNAYDFLCEAIQARNHADLTRFVSFNYDVLLERSLFRINPAKEQISLPNIIWHPGQNYGAGFEKYFPLDQVRPGGNPTPRPFSTPAKGLIYVYKPHGSLYWFAESKSSDGSIWPLLDDSAGNLPGLPPRGDAFLSMVNRFLADNNGSLKPVLIPPSPTKAAAGRLFWDIWKRIEDELLKCESVVVIGWNMPATDLDVRTRIAEVIARRREPIEKLVVCDVRKSQIFYQRFVAAFRPKQVIESWREGFTQDFIEKRLIPELMSSRT